MAEIFTGSNPFVIPRAIINRGGVRVATLTGNETWTLKTSTVQILNGGASNRTITLPTIGTNCDGAKFVVYNAGTTNDIILSDGGNVVTIAAGGWAAVYSEGTDWTLGDSSSSSSTTHTDGTAVYFGTGNDIGIAWDGTRLNVTQAATNSEIRWGVDGAGIDQTWYGDTASAACTWDQSADSLILSGVAKIKLQTIAAATGTAIPVTHSGSFPVTTAAAETNTLADPSFLGQTLTIFVDTYAVGDRVITAASRINQAGNTIITLGAVGDFIKLEAITIAGALKWQVVANDGAALSGP